MNVNYDKALVKPHLNLFSEFVLKFITEVSLQEKFDAIAFGVYEEAL